LINKTYFTATSVCDNDVQAAKVLGYLAEKFIEI